MTYCAAFAASRATYNPRSESRASSISAAACPASAAAWNSWIAAAGSAPLAAALGFVLSRPEIDVALVGVTRLAELQEIVATAALPLPTLDWPALALDDETALTPSRW